MGMTQTKYYQLPYKLIYNYVLHFMVTNHECIHPIVSRAS